MSRTLERLKSLHVADAMTRQVVTVGANETMTSAAKTLADRQVSGAVVVDEADRCVGLLSAHDFVRMERARAEADPRLPASATAHKLVQDRREGPYRVEEVGGDRVRTYMSPAVQTIDSSALLLDAARRMCALHVHRLPVLDASGRAAGIVTSLDLVAAMVHAVDEESLAARAGAAEVGGPAAAPGGGA